MEADVAEFKEKLEELGESIDDLEEVLKPLLKQNLADIASKLPLLEKAKLNVLTTYAIESLIFSYLKLNGIDAKEHPVFTELTRVKQYFAKIEKAEKDGRKEQGQTLKLDAPAAGRFIKHALAGNEAHDRRKADQQSQQGQQRLNSKIVFDEPAESSVSTKRSNLKKRKAVGELVTSLSSSSSSSASSEDSDATQSKKTKKKKKEQKKPATDSDAGSSSVMMNSAHEGQDISSTASTPQQQRHSHQRDGKERKHKNKSKTRHSRHAKVKSDKPPRDGSAVFKDLLNRPKKQAKSEDG